MKSIHFNVYEAKTRLSQLIEMAKNGEEVIIDKSGRPMVKLVAIQDRRRPRQPGVWKDNISIAQDFDALSPEIQSLFHGR